MNMEYCRFQNTLIDLKDCYDNMDGVDMSDDERHALDRLLLLCATIAESYCDEIDDLRAAANRSRGE